MARKVTELHPVLAWDCEECGRENVLRNSGEVVLKLEGPDYRPVPIMTNNGVFLIGMIEPDQAKCKWCGHLADVEINLSFVDE